MKKQVSDALRERIIEPQKSSHTPGPWRSTLDAETNQFGIHTADGTIFALLVPSRVRNFGANARLIAAAPEMLDALKLALRNEEARLYMLPASDDYEVSCQKDILSAAIGRYRAAISKAEGGQ